MPKTGDFYQANVIGAHLDWGSFRHTDSREKVDGEAYIQIPARFARELGIFNSNNFAGQDVYGGNLFYCNSSDGSYSAVLKAQGSTVAGDVYAKQFAENNNLQGLGRWYAQCGAEEGDMVQVEWVSDDSLEITLIKA